MSLPNMALLIAGGLFIAFILLKLSPLLAGPRAPGWQDARSRIQQAKRRANDATLLPAQRAMAWREAALAALEGLERPNLAASYALRAERMNPEDTEAVRLVSLAMRRGHRYQALERVLWRRLSSEALDAPAYTRAFDELVRLYEGPLRAPERAAALKRLRGGDHA